MRISASLNPPVKRRIVERWSDKRAGVWSCEGREGYIGLTFVSRHRSTAAARVGCLLFPRHVPLCGIPAGWRQKDRVSECFGYCQQMELVLQWGAMRMLWDDWAGKVDRGVWVCVCTLYSGSMSSSISLPVRVRTLERPRC